MELAVLCAIALGVRYEMSGTDVPYGGTFQGVNHVFDQRLGQLGRRSALFLPGQPRYPPTHPRYPPTHPRYPPTRPRYPPTRVLRAARAAAWPRTCRPTAPAPTAPALSPSAGTNYRGHVPYTLGHVPYRLGHVPYTLGHVLYGLGHVPYALGHVPHTPAHVPYTL
eukprot:680314-Rhodomonas_salina.1